MRTEKALAIVILIGFIFQILHWKGANMILMLALVVLWLMYLGFAFYFFSDKTVKNQKLPLSIIAGFLLSTLPIGILFRLLHWKGADFMLNTGIFCGCLVLAYVFITKNKNLGVYYNNLLIRAGILTSISLLLYFTPLSALIKVQNLQDPEMARLKIQAYQHPDNIAYRDSLDNYINKNYPVK